jgi:predicted TIM-barrel fold metal-dependent hydrolase
MIKPVTSRLISADSHVNLSHEQIKGHLASRYHDDYDEAFDRWMSKRVLDDGRVKANLGSHMSRPGYREAQAHLEDMDTDGLDTEVVYCEVSAFRYLYLMDQGGPDATRAFNDTLADYGSVDPKRLIVSYQIPIHDIDTAVAEVERVAGAGGKSLQLPVFPTELGLPDYVDARYDPLWSAIQATGLPICCHTGFNTHLDDLQRRDPTPQAGITIPMMALSCGEALGMWVIGGIFERFPGLKVVFVEPGLGWVAWWVRYVDVMVEKHAYVFPVLKELPSFYFRRNVFVTFMEEPVAVQLLRHELGVSNMMWASDYPHPPTTWPNSRAILDEQFRGVPDEERDLIVSGNAARVWNL